MSLETKTNLSCFDSLPTDCQNLVKREGLFLQDFLVWLEEEPLKAFNEVAELLFTMKRLTTDHANNVSIPQEFIVQLEKLKCNITLQIIDQFKPSITNLEMFPVEETGTTRSERAKDSDKTSNEVFPRDRWALEVLLAIDPQINPNKGDYLHKEGTLLFVIKSPRLGKAILVSRKQGKATFIVPLDNWEEYAQRSRASLLKEAQISDSPVEKVIMPRTVHGDKAIPVWKGYFKEALKKKLPSQLDGYSTINSFAKQHAETLGKNPSSISRKTKILIHQILKNLKEEEGGGEEVENPLTQLKKELKGHRTVARIRARGGSGKRNPNNPDGELKNKKSIAVIRDEILELVLEQITELLNFEDYSGYKTLGEIVKELRTETGKNTTKTDLEEILKTVLEEITNADNFRKELWGKKKIDWYYHPDIIKNIKYKYKESLEKK